MAMGTAEKDDVEIMFSKPNEQIPFKSSMFSGSFYFNIQDVNSLWEQLKDKTEICYNIEDFSWQMRNLLFMITMVISCNLVRM